MKIVFQVLFYCNKEYTLIMKILRVFLASFIAVSVLVTIFFGRYKIAENPKSTTDYKGIITLWQVDSFEGGAGSRKQFLLDVAREFERQNQGVLVMVVNQTEESMEENYKQGILPDLISFGAGTNVQNAHEINVKKEFVGGRVGDKIYALPWCRGGYALIYNNKLTDGKYSENDRIVIGQKGYTEPLVSLVLESIKSTNFEVKQPLDAYVEFTAGKTPYFLGTQRDVVRLSRRGLEAGIIPLTEFNDLYQYISITSDDGEKKYYAEKFVEYLLGEQVQKSLNKICMMSVFYNVEFSELGLNEMQGVKIRKTISAFSDKNVLKDLTETSKSWLETGAGIEELYRKIQILNV